MAIPTHNRAASLRESLEQLASLRVPADVEWELLVVENACRDATVDVTTEFRQRLPIRCVTEPRLGVSNARNMAVESARGQYIIFTDDDTLVDAMWLTAYMDAFVAYPEAAVFGGPIVARFTTAPPDWLKRTFSLVATAYGQNLPEMLDAGIGKGILPFGANMAFRADILRDHSFNPKYGPIGTKRINGSETDLICRLLSAGQTGRWVSGATVEHRIHARQMTTRFLRWYYAGCGAAMAAQPIHGSTPPMLLGRPRWMWRTASTTEIRYRCRRLYATPEVWVQDLKEASIARGQLRCRATLAS
ncbi:MAG: glycosyltransferase [Gemmatimonadaceae bacterium]